MLPQVSSSMPQKPGAHALGVQLSSTQTELSEQRSPGEQGEHRSALSVPHASRVSTGPHFPAHKTSSLAAWQEDMSGADMSGEGMSGVVLMSGVSTGGTHMFTWQV